MGCGIFGRYLREKIFGDVYDARLKVHGYEIINEEIGRGLFSKIKRATYNGIPIAVKIMDREVIPLKFKENNLHFEIQILRQIQHKNIVEIFQIFENTPKVYIFMEYIDGKTLTNYIQDTGRMGEYKARFFFHQVVNAIGYLHSLLISHRDIKPENLMISNKKEVKIIDFSLAIPFGTSADMSLESWGRSPFTAPEFSQSSYNPMSFDIWSMGAILFFMVTGFAPFANLNLENEQKTRSIRYPTDYELSSLLKELLNRMLEPVADRRPLIEQVKQSEWFLINESS